MFYGDSFILVTLYFMTININYSIAILPDHDLIETNHNYKRTATDWGEIQVRNSGNFAMDNSIYTIMYGGINYQIEHHLFPTLCSYHLESISHIVREVCHKHDIKYVSIPTLWEALMSAIQNLYVINNQK